MTANQRFAESLGEMQTLYVQAYLDGWESYLSLMSDLARSPGSYPAAQRRYYEYLSQEAPAMVNKIASTGMQLYRAALDTSSELASQFYGELSASRTTKQQPPPQAKQQPESKPHRELSFPGFTGQKPARQFTVANKTGQPLEIAFELSEFVSDDGQRVRATADLTPDLFSLQPGEEKTVECRILITSSFAQGMDYYAILRAKGLPEMRLILCVTSYGLPEPVQQV